MVVRVQRVAIEPRERQGSSYVMLSMASQMCQQVAVHDLSPTSH
jgi:hypothetical protein